jgi:hypothetical protein
MKQMKQMKQMKRLKSRAVAYANPPILGITKTQPEIAGKGAIYSGYGSLCQLRL